VPTNYGKITIGLHLLCRKKCSICKGGNIIGYGIKEAVPNKKGEKKPKKAACGNGKGG
jgi:hypothetical protein